MERNPALADRSFGQRVELLRLAKGWTQAALAGAVGVTEETVRQWELGAFPRFDAHRQALAAAVGASVEELFRGTSGERSATAPPAPKAAMPKKQYVAAGALVAAVVQLLLRGHDDMETLRAIVSEFTGTSMRLRSVTAQLSLQRRRGVWLPVRRGPKEPPQQLPEDPSIRRQNVAMAIAYIVGVAPVYRLNVTQMAATLGVLDDPASDHAPAWETLTALIGAMAQQRGARLRQRMVEAGVTIPQLATRIGCPPEYLYAVTAGSYKYTVQMDHMARMHGALDELMAKAGHRDSAIDAPDPLLERLRALSHTANTAAHADGDHALDPRQVRVMDGGA